MKLSRLKVANHSRLTDAEIEIRDHLVLIGPNETGKSSVLRCLDLLLGASTAQLYSRVGPSDFRERHLPLVVEVRLDSFTDDDKALFPDEITVDVAAGTSFLTVRLEVTIDADDSLDVRRTAPGAGTGRQLSRKQVAGIGWKMIGATSTVRDLRGDRSGVVDDILRSIDLGEERAGFDALVTELERKLAGSSALEQLRVQLSMQLSRALPTAIDTKDLTFVPGASATDDVLNDVRLHVRHDGEPRGLSDQSDGTRALFAIALYDLVSAAANVVAIDEPEIHLHPTGQRSLAKLLRAGTNQKIIATHSADIVGAFDSDCVVTVKSGGRLVQPKAGFLSDDERMLVRWWVRDKLEPLTAARVLAVEGISDRVILERAATVTGRELDRLGVSVIETDGAGAMAAVVKLFGPAGFQIDASLLIDADAVDDTADKLGVAVTDLTKHSVWISTPDLEAEYVAALGAPALWSAIESSGLFSRNELANCAATGLGGVRTDDDVATFCRLKSTYKVRAAIAAAKILTDTSARAITSVEALLGELAGV